MGQRELWRPALRTLATRPANFGDPPCELWRFGSGGSNQIAKVRLRPARSGWGDANRRLTRTASGGAAAVDRLARATTLRHEASVAQHLDVVERPLAAKGDQAGEHGAARASERGGATLGSRRGPTRSRGRTGRAAAREQRALETARRNGRGRGGRRGGRGARGWGLALRCPCGLVSARRRAARGDKEHGRERNEDRDGGGRTSTPGPTAATPPRSPRRSPSQTRHAGRR